MRTLTAAGLGAGLMYLFDPNRGKRRRAVLRDRFASGVHRSADIFDKAGRDLRNRAHGLSSSARCLFDGREADDEILVARVRSRIGRATSHPGAIDVDVKNGHVTLLGHVLREEEEWVLASARATPGIRSVETALEVHEYPDAPALQGGSRRSFARRAGWKPTGQLLGAIAGGGLMLYSLGRGRLVGPAIRFVGATLLTRSMVNRTFGSLVGLDGGSEIEIQKTVTIHAPVEEVFQFWSNYSNFPRIMSHLEEVRDLGDNRSRWVAVGPANIPVSWNAKLTESIPNKLLAWESEPESMVRNSGVVRFEPAPENGTRINVRMSYAPPAGMLGHVVASLFGADPKHEIDDDLIRMKSLIELGRTTAHGHKVTRDQFQSAGV